MSHGSFTVTDSQFRLAAVARIVLNELPEQTLQALNNDFETKEKPEALLDLGMLANYVSISLGRVYLALSEFILSFSSCLSEVKNNEAILSSKTLEFERNNDGLIKIPKHYFISRVAKHARIDMETAKIVFNTILEVLKKNEVKIECLRCSFIPPDLLRFKLDAEEPD